MKSTTVRSAIAGSVLLAVAFIQGCATSSGASAPGAPAESESAIVPATSAAGVLSAKSSELDAGGHERLGDAHVGQGDLERAYFEYRESLRLEPGRVAVRYKAARLLLRRGLLAEAEEEFRAVLTVQPDSAPALLGLGQTAFLAGKPETEQLLRDALAHDPGLWQAHNLLGLFYEREGFATRAVTEYYAALAINAGECSVTNNLGVAQLRDGNDAQAVLAFKRALEVGCAAPRVSNNLGLALTRLGRRDEALEAFRRAGTDAAAWNNLGYALLTAGKAAEAIEAFEKAIAADPAYFERAQVNLKRARAARDLSRPGDSPKP